MTDINEVIIHYLDGSASFEEKVQLLQWLIPEENRTDFIQTRDIWLSSNAAISNEQDVEIALDKLKDRIAAEKRQTYKFFGRPAMHWARIAAILFLLLGFSYWIGLYNGKSGKEVIVRNQLITATGGKGRFVLPDNTVVWLNSGSKLTYPEHFPEEKRIVSLEGEAYFEVEKDLLKPFVVQMEQIDIEVLGTCFNVSNYAEQDIFKTALLSGSIKIKEKKREKEITLLPNQLFEYHKRSCQSTIQIAKVGLYADWIKDKLVFDNDQLSDILISMAGRYNVRFECPDDFARSTNMSFTIRQESLEEIMNAMISIVPMKYHLVGNNVLIEPQ